VPEMLPLKRGGGVRGVAHSFNCTPTFVDMHLADALVLYFDCLVRQSFSN